MKIDEVEIKSSEAIHDKSSIFHGHAVKIKNSGDLRTAYKKIKTPVPRKQPHHDGVQHENLPWVL